MHKKGAEHRQDDSRNENRAVRFLAKEPEKPDQNGEGSSDERNPKQRIKNGSVTSHTALTFLVRPNDCVLATRRATVGPIPPLYRGLYSLLPTRAVCS